MKRRRNFADKDFFCRIHILSATLLICSQAEKTRDIMSLMSVFTREWVSPTDLSCFTDSLQNIHRRALLFIDNKTDNLLEQCWISRSAQTNLSSIYRHELIVIYCALMKHQALLTIQAKLKLAIIFLLFGHDTIWRIPRKRVARGGKL